jgi:hypothetical protein
MKLRIGATVLAVALGAGASLAWAKLPPPPPMDDKAKAAAEEKKAKDAAAAEQAKQDQAAAEEKAVHNYQDNMKKMGKTAPKPTPVAPPAAAAAAPPAAAAAPPAAGAQPAPASNTAKVDDKGKQEAAQAANAQGKK